MREGWETITMLEACNLITCGVAARPKYVDDGIPFLSAKNVKNGQIIYKNYNCITVDNHKELTKKNKPLIGDILYTRVGSYGEAAVIEENIEFSVFVSLTLIKPNKAVLNSYFLKYYLNSHGVKTLAKKSIKSSGVGNLNVGTVRKFPIPIPPLSEQKQIVKTLDLAFKQIDQAKANLEKNLNNAKELFQSKLNEVFSQRGEGWEEKRLKEITTKIGSGSTPRGGQSSYKESGISLIRSMNVHDKGFQEKKLAFIDDEQALKLKNVTLEKDDVLLNITGASVARCCIVPEAYLPARVNQHVSIIRLKKDILHTSYLHYCLTAQENKNKLLNIGRQGSTREAITKVQIENFVIFYPKNMAKQLEVLKSLNIFKEKSELLETHYQHKLNNLEELKKSILEKAFKGEL